MLIQINSLCWINVSTYRTSNFKRTTQSHYQSTATFGIIKEASFRFRNYMLSLPTVGTGCRMQMISFLTIQYSIQPFLSFLFQILHSYICSFHRILILWATNTSSTRKILVSLISGTDDAARTHEFLLSTGLYILLFILPANHDNILLP